MKKYTLIFALLTLNFLSLNSAFAYEPLTSDEFLENKLMVDTAISPDGKSLATIWYIDKTNSNIVTIQDLTQESKPIITTINERITLPQVIYWANNERIVMKLRIPKFLKDAKAKLKEDPENFNIYNFITRTVTVSINKNGEDLVQFRSKKNGDLINIIRDFLDSDPDHILMEQYNDGRRELKKVNIYTGIGVPIVFGGKSTIKFISDEQGKPLYRVDYLSVSKAYEIFEYVNNEWKSFEKVYLRSLMDEVDENFDAHDSDLIGMKKGQLTYLKANTVTGYKEIITINTKTKEKITLASLPNQDIHGVLSSRKDSEITGYTYIDKDIKRRVYFDPKKQAINERVGQYFPYDSFRLFGDSDDQKVWIIKSNGASEQAYYLYYDDTQKLDFYSTAHKKRLTENLGFPANLTYKTRDNLDIRSYLLLPPTYEKGKRYPLIVYPHGGPQSRDYASFDLLAQFLATRGYIVIQPNFRGSTGYGKEFKEMGFKSWGGAMQDDLEDAVHFLVKKGYADKNKVCILGGSYGGYAAMMALVKTPELYQCAVSINGVSDIKDMVKHKKTVFKDRSPILDFIKQAYGDIKTDNDYFNKSSPIKHIDKITKPVLILAGERDNTVLVEQSTSFVDALEGANKSVEAYYSKWSGHNLFYYSNCRKEGYKKIEAFLSKHLHVPLITKPDQKVTQKKKSFWQKEDEVCLKNEVSI